MIARRDSMKKWLTGALLLGIACLTLAQDWPVAKPIRLIVAYPAGGVSDQMARALADKLTVQLGTPVLVENKAGAGGSLGVDAVAKAAADGYTLGFAAISPLSLDPHLGSALVDPQSVAPVVSVMYSPVLLLGTSASKATDFKELIGLARQQPGALRLATAGQGSLGHLMLEQIQAAAQVQITHIPYKGGGQQINDALGGQFEVLAVNATATVLQHIKAGKLRPLAVGAPARLDALPDVPTLAELQQPGANRWSLFGIYAPARTAPAIIARFNTEVNKALALPDIRSGLRAGGNQPTGGSSAEFARQIAQESESNARIIRAAGIVRGN
ncbi:tripartite tricarboxylate transporter substrate binding protein [Verminephrobacter eiseniae]|nr:tripartite tricarboxylate transporter substrate binding protein [Verminephrobacter eiseniae]